MRDLTWKDIIALVTLGITACILWLGVIANLMGYMGKEAIVSGGARIISPSGFSTPVLDCVEGNHVIIDGEMTQHCTGDSHDAGQLYIPGGYDNEK